MGISKDGWFIRKNPSIKGWFGGTHTLGNHHMCEKWSSSNIAFFLPGGYSWVQTIRRFPVFFLRKVRCRELGKELGRELGKGKGTGKTQQIQSRPRKGIGKTKQLQSCLRKRVGKAQQLQSCLRKGNGRRPELNQQSARKDKISRNRKTRCSPRTRMLTRMLMVQMLKHVDMQSRRTLVWNSLFEQSCAFFPCYCSSAP